MVAKKLREIVISRGKKGIDRSEQVEMLQFLATVASGPAQKVEVRPSQFTGRCTHLPTYLTH